MLVQQPSLLCRALAWKTFSYHKGRSLLAEGAIRGELSAQGLKIKVTLTVTSLSQQSGNCADRAQLQVPWDREVCPISLDLSVVGLCSPMLLRGLVAWIPVCQEGFSSLLGCCLPTFR